MSTIEALVNEFRKGLKQRLSESDDENERAMDLSVLDGAPSPRDCVMILEQVISEGAKNNVENLIGISPIHFVARVDSDVKILKYIVSQNGDAVHIKDTQYGATPLHFAAINQHSNPDIAKCLVDHRAHINAQNSFGLTPLHLAASDGKPDIAILQCLIDAGANISVKNNNGLTPLDFANSEEKRRIMRVALAKK